MKDLLIEQIDFDSIENDVEEITEGLSKKKNFYIKGPMLVAETVNGNKRVYPRPVIESQVAKYQDLIKAKRSVGEAEHPTTSSINIERITHLVTELKMDGNIAYGKAKILDHKDVPMGRLLRGLMEEGVKIGVSSRGTGSLKNGIVQNDYCLHAIDAVFNPSGPNCFVSGIMEGKEWILENGILTEKEIEETKKEVEKILVENKFSKEDRQAAFYKLFQDNLAKISAKIK
jgi:hypothetical protein